MTLTPDRIQYLELRAQVRGFLLAYHVSEPSSIVEFYGDHAESVARVTGLSLTYRGEDQNGAPIAVCGFPVELIAIPGDAICRFEDQSVDYYNAIMDAGLPMAVAVETGMEDGAKQREVVLWFRPQIGRPPV